LYFSKVLQRDILLRCKLSFAHNTFSHKYLFELYFFSFLFENIKYYVFYMIFNNINIDLQV